MKKIIKISIVITVALALTLPGAAVFIDVGKLIKINDGGNEPIDGPPFDPSNPDPEQGATDVSILTQLEWDGGDPDPGDLIHYDIFFGTENPPQYFDTLGPYPGNQIEIVCDLEQLGMQLEHDTHYYWQIVAYDQNAWYTPGLIWDFITEGESLGQPFKPSNPDPPDGAIDVNIDTNLSWDGGDPDEGDKVYYSIFFGTDTDPLFVETIGPYDGHVIRISWDPGILNYSTTYYWKITAYDGGGSTTPGPIWHFTTEGQPNNPPYMPSNPDPPDGATDISILTNLSWDGGDPDPGDEVTYYIFFGTVLDPPYIENIGPYPWDQIRISWDPGFLNYNTKYYWKILAHDGESYLISPIWNFTTEEANNPPYTPSNPNPANGSSGIDINSDLSWDGGDPDSGDNVYYDIYFGTDPAPPFMETIGPYPAEQIEISWDPGTLEYSTQYYWWIIPYDDHICGMPSPVWEFTTEELPNDPPFIPSNPDPANDSTGVSINLDLSWDGGDPDLGDFVYYDIYFGIDTIPPFIKTIGPYSSNQIQITWDPGTLEYSTHYYWQIVAHDTFEHFSDGPIWNFITEEEPNSPPFPPSNPDPDNGSTDVNINKILGWTGGDPDGDQVTYDVYFGTVTPPPKLVSNQTGTTYNPGTMSYNTMYYWQIVAWDIHEASTQGPIWEFTTEEEPNNPPYPPSDPNPEHGAIDVSVDEDLSWIGGDPDSGDTVTYDIYFGTITPPPKVVDNQSETVYHPGTMSYSTKYYWQIVAWDIHNASTEGPIWNFTTEEPGNNPPGIPIISGPAASAPEMILQFSAVSYDPEENQVLYNFSWGDGNYSGWLGPINSGENITANYSWFSNGIYGIQVKAKDIHEAESDWSEPHNITISKQMEISNIESGYVYFRYGILEGSYAYIHLLDNFGFSVVLGNVLTVEATTSDVVHSVKFKIVNLFWGDNDTYEDDDGTDGFSANFSIPTGLWSVITYAYDEEENLIDMDDVQYLLFYVRGSSEQGMRRINNLRNILRDRIINR